MRSPLVRGPRCSACSPRSAPGCGSAATLAPADPGSATPSSAATPASTSKRPRRSRRTTTARSAARSSTNASLRGMVRGAAQALQRPLPRLLLARNPEGLQRSDRRPLLRHRADRQRGQDGPRRSAASSNARRPTRPGSQAGRRDRQRSTASRSPGVESSKATARSRGRKGPRSRSASPDGKNGKVEQNCGSPAPRSRSRSPSARSARSTAASSATSGSRPSAKAPTPTSARRSKRCEREGAEGIVLDLRANGGGLLEEAVLAASIFLPEDEVVVTTDSRTQGHSEYETVGESLAGAAARRPDRPQHGLGRGDPRRGPRRRRPAPRWSAPAPSARASSSRRSTSPTAAR